MDTSSNMDGVMYNIYRLYTTRLPFIGHYPSEYMNMYTVYVEYSRVRVRVGSGFRVRVGVKHTRGTRHVKYGRCPLYHGMRPDEAYYRSI